MLPEGKSKGFKYRIHKHDKLFKSNVPEKPAMADKVNVNFLSLTLNVISKFDI